MLSIIAAMKIRLFSPEHLRAILEIQKVCKPAAAWRSRDYEQLADDPKGMILVAELGNQGPPKPVGFSVSYRVEQDAELWNIAVTPAFRRQGIARSLLRENCRILTDAGARRLFLEVRESNIPARQLYYSFGFTLLGRREKYYQNPTEDALVLVRELDPYGV